MTSDRSPEAASGAGSRLPAASSGPFPSPERPASGASAVAPAAVLALVVIAFAASRFAIAAVPSEREYDEGVYLLSARAVARGYELFAEVFSSQPPAFVETLALAFRVFGDRLVVARSLILAFSLLALLAAGDLARRLAGRWAAPAAAAALALTMAFGDLAHVVEAEAPALAVALVSLALCLESRRRGWHRGWLVASGAVFALGALFKLLVVPLAAPFGLLLLLAPAAKDEREWRLDRSIGAVAGRCAVVAMSAAAVLALPLLCYDVAALYEQAVAFHLNKHAVFDLNELANLRRAVGHFRADAAMVATACVGLVALVARGRALAAVWLVVWLLAMLAAIAAQTPLFWRHFVLLSPPVAIAAGAGLVTLAGESSRRRALLVLAAIAVWTGATLSQKRAMFPLLSDGARIDRSLPSLEAAASWIRMNTEADELVGGDDPMAIFLGGRLSPPQLCDTSKSRIVSESLQVEEAARASLAARVIVTRNGGRLSLLPGYFGWLKKNYSPRPAAYTGLGPQRTAWIRGSGANADARNPPSILDGLSPPPGEAPEN